VSILDGSSAGSDNKYSFRDKANREHSYVISLNLLRAKTTLHDIVMTGCIDLHDYKSGLYSVATLYNTLERCTYS
jgi:hypothetical protein